MTDKATPTQRIKAILRSECLLYLPYTNENQSDSDKPGSDETQCQDDNAEGRDS